MAKYSIYPSLCENGNPDVDYSVPVGQIEFETDMNYDSMLKMFKEHMDEFASLMKKS